MNLSIYFFIFTSTNSLHFFSMFEGRQGPPRCLRSATFLHRPIPRIASHRRYISNPSRSAPSTARHTPRVERVPSATSRSPFSPEDELSHSISRVIHPPRFDRVLPAQLPKPTATDLRRMSDFEQILIWVTPCSSNTKVTPGHLPLLLDFISHYIFRPHFTSSTHIAHAAVATVTHYPQLEKVHKIFCQFLTHDPNLISQTIDVNFAHKLVKQLTVSVTAERRYLQKEIAIIARICPDLTSPIKRFLLTLVVESIHNYRAVDGLPAVVALLAPLLELSLSNRTYRSAIVALYALRSYVGYAADLRTITRFFALWHEGNADYCVNYLLNHWPMTNAVKEVAFLGEIADLFEFLSDDGLIRNRKRMMARLTRSLASKHARVAEAAARVLQIYDNGRGLLTGRQTVPHALVVAIGSARDHWHENVRKAGQTLGLMVQKKPTTKPRSEEMRSQVWNQISKSASRNHEHIYTH
jgi:hypothetical protein